MQTPLLPLTLRAIFIGLLALAGVPAYAAIGGQPDAADVRTIETCLADASTAKADADACFGRVSRTCLETAPTTAAKVECSDRELLVWNAALNRDYEQLTALLTEASVRQALRDAELAFVAEKSKKCTFDRIAHHNSPDALIAAAQCDVKATARQDLWLREQINSFKSH